MWFEFMPIKKERIKEVQMQPVVGFHLNIKYNKWFGYGLHFLMQPHSLILRRKFTELN